MGTQNATIVMMVSLLAAVLLAIGHHLFCAAVHQQFVESQVQQEWFIRIGTGLAFVVKTLLGVASATAYLQIMWYILRRRDQGLSISGVKSFFAAHKDVFVLFDAELWAAAPALLLAAFFIWMLPLVAVVTPSSLTVQPSVNSTVQNLPVPNIAYDNFEAYAELQIQNTSRGAISPLNTYNGDWAVNYRKASNRLTRVVSSVASSGKILNIAPPTGLQDSSYSLNTYGLAYSCILLEDAGALEAIDSTMSLYADTWLDAYAGAPLSYIGYLGYLLLDRSGNTADYFKRAVIDGLFGNNSATLNNGCCGRGDAGSAFFTFLGPGSSPGNDSWDTISCGLYNASYAIDFTFVAGQQTVTVTNKTLLNGISAPVELFWFTNTTANLTSHVAGMSMMYSLNTLILGKYAYSQPGTDRSEVSSSTQIGSTVLAESHELQDMFTRAKTQPGPISIPDMPFAAALEEVVQNVTLSLFSDSFFLQNASATQNVPVVVNTTKNIYYYSAAGRRNLALSYGLGAGVSALLVVISLTCLASAEGQTPTDIDLSSILLVTRKLGTEVDRVVANQSQPPRRPWWRRCWAVKACDNLANLQIFLAPNKEETHNAAWGKPGIFQVIHKEEITDTSSGMKVQGAGKGSRWVVMSRRQDPASGPLAAPLMVKSPEGSASMVGNGD